MHVVLYDRGLLLILPMRLDTFASLPHDYQCRLSAEHHILVSQMRQACATSKTHLNLTGDSQLQAKDSLKVLI